MARKTIQRDPYGTELSEYEEEEQEDGGILRDGQSVRIPLYMKDGSINPNLTPTQHGKAMHQTEDQTARRFGLTDGLQLHKPGFRRVTDAAALERMQQAYTAYDAADAAACKQTRDYNEFTGSEPRLTGTGAPAKGYGNPPPGSYPLNAGEDSSCSIDGSPGTLVRQGNWLVCKPRQRQDAATFDAKAAAYADYDREMANAWRGPNR